MSKRKKKQLQRLPFGGFFLYKESEDKLKSIYCDLLKQLANLADSEVLGLMMEPKNFKNRLAGIQDMRSVLDDAEQCIKALQGIKKGIGRFS